MPSQPIDPSRADRARRRVRVLFSGLDGAGKTSCLDALIRRLQGSHRVLRIGTTGFEAFHRGHREHLIDSAPMERLGTRLRGGPLYGLWLACNHLYKFVSAGYYARFGDFDVVFYETDTLVNPTVYLAYHFPALCRVLGPRRRFALMSAVFGSPRSTLLFYLDVDPALSVERCNRREAEGGMEVEPHQTLEALTLLRAEFAAVTAAAAARGYDLVSIDTRTATLEQVVGRAGEALARRLPPGRG